MSARFAGRGLDILDFDIEARPLSWYGGDFVTREVTAIAAGWVGPNGKPKGRIGVALLTLDPDSGPEMLNWFLDLYNEADMVTGHFIRGYDLPNLNGALSEHNLPLLDDKLSQDTKLDLVKRSGMSNSQENLGAMLGLKHPKISMDQAKWRAANRLTPEGLALTEKRVVGDVAQHIEMRQVMLDRGMLSAPRVWSSTAKGVGKYHA